MSIAAFERSRPAPRCRAFVLEEPMSTSVRHAAGAATLRQQLAEGVVDAVTLTSASAVRYFSEAVGRAHGLAIGVEAYPHTGEGWVAGLISYFARHRGSRRNG